MIPAAFRSHHLQGAGEAEPARQRALTAARLETAAALGFISAIGAYGGWLIPQAYAVSTSLTGRPVGALYVLIAIYATCLWLTWRHFMRPGLGVVASPALASAEV